MKLLLPKRIKAICPSMLDYENKEEAIEFLNKIIEAGIKNVHYDVLDGKFLSNPKSYTADLIKKTHLNTQKHIMDIHLMVQDPESWIKDLDFADIITFHYEAVGKQKAIELVKKYQTKNLAIGLAINPETSFEEIKDLISLFKLILVMGVHPGKGGQAFIPETLTKAKQIKNYILQNSLDTKIQMDGGIKYENIQKTFEAGVDWVVMGSYILSHNSQEQLKDLSNQADKWRRIYLAGGCFWGMQAWAKLQKGVIKTSVGYANSTLKNPSYEDLKSGASDAVEAVEIYYDATLTSSEKLLTDFLSTIDPTALNFQGPDYGLQYRNGIYWDEERDSKLTQDEIKKIITNVQPKYKKPIVTEYSRIKNFYLAEEYHQDYLDKNPGAYCHIKL